MYSTYQTWRNSIPTKLKQSLWKNCKLTNNYALSKNRLRFWIGRPRRSNTAKFQSLKFVGTRDMDQSSRGNARIKWWRSILTFLKGWLNTGNRESRQTVKNHQRYELKFGTKFLSTRGWYDKLKIYSYFFRHPLRLDSNFRDKNSFNMGMMWHSSISG